MLCLKVYENQVLYLGDDIEIRVVEVFPEGKAVKLGVTCPDDMVVLREHLKREFDKLSAEERKAAIHDLLTGNRRPTSNP